MPGPLLPFALALALAAPADTADDPRTVVREATRAVERDSTRLVAAQWQARLEQDSTDRAALLGLATLARLTYDYPTAERLYRRLSAADLIRPDRYAAYAGLGWAWALQAIGRSDEAATEFSRARATARALRNPAAEGEALIGRSLARGKAEGLAVGLALLDTAGRLIPESAPELQARHRWRRAWILAILGRPGAMAEAKASIALARRAGELRAEAHGLHAMARVFGQRQQHDSALIVLRQAEQLYQRARDRSTLALATLLRAETLLQRGELGEMREALRLALVEAEASHNRLAVATVYTGLGALAIHLNDFAAAAEHLKKAVALHEALGNPLGAMAARDFLPYVTLAAGDLAAARRQTLELLAFYRRSGEMRRQFWEYRVLASMALRERDWAAAERWLADAHTLARRLKRPLWIAELANDDGQLALSRGDLARAERSFVKYLRTLDSAEHVHRHDARLQLTEVYARRGELERAEREAISAWDELEHWRASLNERELRLLAFQASDLEREARDASLARVLGELAAGGRAASAFEFAERRRARELADRLARTAALRTDGGPARKAVAGARPSVNRVTAAEMAALIPDDSTAVLEYVTGAFGAPTTLFVVTRAGVRAHILPPADSLIAEIRRFVALTEAGTDARGLARSLGAALLGPALAALLPVVTRLVVVPDGPLHRLPFDALRLPDGRYMAEQYAVGLAPSAAVAAALWQRPLGDGRTVRLLAFGDPAFAGETTPNTSSEAGEYRAAFRTAGGLARLSASGREARLVARYAHIADVRLRERASAAYLKRAPLEAFRVIHFATHALVDERSMARTALALAPGGGESGFLSPGDLAALTLNADLVVLSACRTAGGVIVGGEGVQGLTAPLLQAGARSIVATGWRIGDRSTVRFVGDFYDALARGLPVSEALREAKLDAISRGAPPAEWAAFTAVGDLLLRIPLKRPPLATAWWIAATALVLALGGAVAYAAQRRNRRNSERRGVSPRDAPMALDEVRPSPARPPAQAQRAPPRVR